MQEETSTAEAEEEDISLNQENNREENEPNCKPVSECSQSDDGPSSSPPRVHSSPRDQLTHGQNFSPVGGMVPGVESRIPIESKTRSDLLSVAMGKERSGTGSCPDQQNDTIHRVQSAPQIRTQPAVPTTVAGGSLSARPDHLETSRASCGGDHHSSAEDASSPHAKQLVRQESDQGVLFNVHVPEVNVVKAVERSEDMGKGKEEVVMVGNRVFGGDRLQVPSPRLGRQKTKKRSEHKVQVCCNYK